MRRCRRSVARSLNRLREYLDPRSGSADDQDDGTIDARIFIRGLIGISAIGFITGVVYAWVYNQVYDRRGRGGAAT
jgi:hypothetical protein